MKSSNFMSFTKISKHISIQIRTTGIIFLGALLLVVGGYEVSVSQDSVNGDTIMVQNLTSSDLSGKNNLVTMEISNLPLSIALEMLAEKAKVGFLYSPEIIPDKMVSMNQEKKVPVHVVLYELLAGTNLEPVLPPSKDVIVIREREQVIVEDLYQQTVRGQVTDAQTGESLPGVNIIVEGTDSGTSTGPDGNFELTVADLQETLIFTYIGYMQQEIPINGRTEINVELQSDVQQLADVVVIGYGTQERGDLTGSISSVSQKEINATASANVMQAIRGRAPGVHVRENTGHPGSAISVRIRGSNSLVGNNEPLYVVDGFPVSDAEVINNSSIESVEILKDASAVAIYGSRASNGVVLITTNRGTAGPTQVNIESSLGYQRIVKDLEFMNALEFGTFMNQRRENDGTTPRFSQSELSEFAAMGEGTNWQDVVYQTAPVHNHSMNISGGDESTRYSLTGSVFEQDGIIKNSGYSRYSITSDMVKEIGSQFTAELNITYSKNLHERKTSQKGNNGAQLINSSFNLPPIFPVYNEDGTYFEPMTVPGARLDHNHVNPLNYIERRSNELAQDNLLANVALSYEINDGLVLRVSGGIEDRSSRSDVYQTTQFFRQPSGSASVSQADFTSYLSENTLNYTGSFGKHDVSAVGGFTYQDFTRTTLSGGGNSFLSDIPQTHDLATASNFSNPNTSYTHSVILSGLGRVNYTYDDRYLFTASLRADGASVYSPGEEWGYFPSLAFSWRLSDEEFLNLDDTIINNLKLRVSWGKAGSQAISPYSTLNQLNAGSIVWDNDLATSMAPGSRLAANLKWETTEQWNIGLEIGLFEGRFNFTADYYDKVTSDLLNAVQLPRSTGYTNTLRNVGSIGNKGIELALSTILYDSQNMSWNVDANVSFNRSKVLDLYEGQDIQAGLLQPISFTAFANIYREGEPLGIILGYEEDGYDENGSLQYKDEIVKLGDPNPDMIFGLNTSVAYKDFSLSAFFQGSLGNDLINTGMVFWTIENRFDLNLLKEVYDNSWTPENPDAKYPAPSSQHDIRFSDRWIYDGSYIKLRNIELAYNVPIPSTRNVDVYVSGQNLLTITNYPGVDPDVNIDGGATSLAQGHDYSGYPQSKSITFGVRLGF